MATRIADTLKQQNNLDTFPVAYGEDIWLDKNKGSGTEDFASIQALYNAGALGGSDIEVTSMPDASASYLDKVLLYVGDTGTYEYGKFYKCVSDGETPPSYSWEDAGIGSDPVDGTTIVKDSSTGELSAVQATQSTKGIVKGGNGTQIGSNGEVNVVDRLEETTELPTATAANESKCYLLTEAQTGYTVGGTYQCQEVTPATEPKTYHWVLISAADVDLSKYKKIFMGTEDDFLALPEATRKEYDELHSPESLDASQITDSITDGDMRAVTSNAVAQVVPSNASASNKLVAASDNNFTYKKLAANTDFNTLITPGLYAVGTDNVSVSHAPIVGTFSVIVSNVADGWVQQLAIFNGDGRTFVRISIPGNWGIWDEVSFLNKVVQKFDTDITPTSGVTGLYNTVVDCTTKLVTALKAKGQGSWSGLITYTGSWSGQYVSLVYNALCVVTGTFRYNNNLYNFYAIHNGTDLKIDTDAPNEGTATVNANVVDTSQYNNFIWKRQGKYVVASIYVGATKSISPATGSTVLATGFPVPFGDVTSMVPVSWAKYNTMFTVQINSSGELVMYSRIDIDTPQIYSGQGTITYECV